MSRITLQTMSRRRPRKKRVVRIVILLILLVAIIILSAIPPLVMGEMVNRRVDFSEVYSAEDFGLTAETLQLQTADGVNVVAYEVDSPADPKAMVIFLSGIHNPSVTAFFGHARMLQEQGYGSILLEMRAHGASEGEVISLGYKEYLDTQAVVDYLTENYPELPIVVYGLSMGAATAINSIGQIDEIDGLISMSAYAGWEDVFYDNMIKMGAPKAYAIIQRPFVKIYSAFKFGFKSYQITPKKQIQNLGARPALIIHSTEDSQIPYSNFERIIQVAPEHVESWVRTGDFHFIVENEEEFFDPQADREYAKRVIAFLNKHFGN